MTGQGTAAERRHMDKQEKGGGKSGLNIHLVLLLASVAIVGSLLWDWLGPPGNSVGIISGADVAGETGGMQTTADSPAVSQTDGNDGTRDLIPIYLVGAVRNPGIYQVVRGSYLYELVEQAGGLTEDAAADLINLAFCLETNQLIRLPTGAEAAAGPASGELTAGPGFPSASEGSRLVDINLADEEQLDSLPGIGPATARAILLYREQNGPFSCIEDLMKIPGIKESRFSALKDLVCVSGST